MARPDPGFPHDYGQPCCCVDCTGPDGEDCSPDVWGSSCRRCNRPAVRDDRETTAEVFEAIAATIATTAQGQLSWLA
jgi:hypothetical protein